MRTLPSALSVSTSLALALALGGCSPAATEARPAPAPWPPAGALGKPVAVPFAPPPPLPAAGEERCTSGCHAGAMETASHAALAAPHAKPGAAPIGCVACHGGDPLATLGLEAHAGVGATELLHGANRGAACAACHVPGAHPATEAVARGALLYLELGCVACHRSGQLGAAAVGPPLDLVGLRGSEYLRAITNDPATFNPQTKMPAFATRFRDRSEEEALVAFLLAQRGRRAAPGELQARPCASCHATSPPSPIPGAAAHRCAYIADRRAELSCARCHDQGLAPSPRACGFVAEHRPACAACHQELPSAH